MKSQWNQLNASEMREGRRSVQVRKRIFLDDWLYFFKGTSISSSMYTITNCISIVYCSVFFQGKRLILCQPVHFDSLGTLPIVHGNNLLVPTRWGQSKIYPRPHFLPISPSSPIKSCFLPYCGRAPRFECWKECEVIGRHAYQSNMRRCISGGHYWNICPLRIEKIEKECVQLYLNTFPNRTTQNRIGSHSCQSCP